MWASIASNIDIDKKDVTKEDILNSIPLLQESSTRIPTPTKCKVELWPHQQAMLSRCKEIESNPKKAECIVRNRQRYMTEKDIPKAMNVPIGVMNDPPGSGKTFAILSLIAMDTSEEEGLNIIVVPQNIYNQWSQAIQTMFPKNEVSYKLCNTYGDATSLYGSGVKELSKYSIILLNDIYAETLFTSINDTQSKTKMHIRRLIIDEIDSVQERLYTPIEADHVWLVSASFTYKERVAVGPYLIKNEDISHVCCKCDPAFIEKQLTFEEPAREIIVCDDDDIALFHGVVKHETLTALNAGWKRQLLIEMGKTFPVTRYSMKQLAEMYIEDLKKSTVRLEEYGNDYNECEDPILKEEYIEVINRLRKLRNSANLLEERLANYVDPVKSKTSEINEICKKIRDAPQSKWLIYNDNAEALYEMYGTLLSNSIKCAMLDGGSAETIHKTIVGYSQGPIQVLLMNSKLEGAGMNLEKTSHILFMHATHERLVSQVVGRAQRWGRVGRLQIIALLNKNELNDIRSGNLKDVTIRESAESN